MTGVASATARTPVAYPTRLTLPLTSNAFVLIAAAHALLAILMWDSPILAGAHAFGALLVSLVATVLRPINACYGIAYLAGSEVLWRMSEAPVFWEFGKYAVCLVALTFLVRLAAFPRRGGALLAYFLLLVPGCWLTLQALGFTRMAREAISFNLSGPASLAAVGIVFAPVRVSEIRLSRVLLACVWPIVGILGVAVYSTLSAITIEFTQESNLTTSGGYGPNQVSAMLGAGALFCVLLATLESKRRMQALLFGLSGAFLLQSVLTFSRGGVYAALICLSFLAVHLLWTPERSKSFLVAIVVLGLVGGTQLLPRLNNWTGGAMAHRFSSLDSTSRIELAREDLRLFREHPGVGVGVGLSALQRSDPRFIGIAPHTEYTRQLAEHGVLGAASLLILLWLLAYQYQRAPTLYSKAWVATTAAWSLLMMVTNAMRLVIFAYVVGIALLDWRGEWDRRRSG